MKVCRGGVEEVHRRHRGLSWWTVPSNQLLPLLTSDPTDSAQLFQAFSSTLPPSPCTPPENPPYLTEHPPSTRSFTNKCCSEIHTQKDGATPAAGSPGSALVFQLK